MTQHNFDKIVTWICPSLLFNYFADIIKQRTAPRYVQMTEDFHGVLMPHIQISHRTIYRTAN